MVENRLWSMIRITRTRRSSTSASAAAASWLVALGIIALVAATALRMIYARTLICP
jgi:hypothetical protein